MPGVSESVCDVEGVADLVCERKSEADDAEVGEGVRRLESGKGRGVSVRVGVTKGRSA